MNGFSLADTPVTCLFISSTHPLARKSSLLHSLHSLTHSLLPVAPANMYLVCQWTPVNSAFVPHIGDVVCDDYWLDFQSSWSWGPTGNQRGAGTRITTTSCFLCWMTRSPAMSCTAWTPRTPWATSGSSYPGHLTSLR